MIPSFITAKVLYWWIVTWPFKYALWVLFCDWVDRRRRRKAALLPKEPKIQPDYCNNYREEMNIHKMGC